MYVGVLQVKVKILDAFTLKDKRQVLRSVFERCSNKFRFSCAEVSDMEIVNLSTFGFSCVSNSYSNVEDRINALIDFLEDDYRFEIVEIGSEIINVNR